MSERRLHPAAAVAEAAQQLRGIAIPLIVVVLAGGASRSAGSALALGALGVLVSLAAGVVGWSREAYGVDEERVWHRSGILRIREVTVPRDRVQGVDTVRGPIQRLFGVLELRVQAAGGGRAPEIALRAVTPQAAAEVRAALGLADAPGAHGPQRRLELGGLLVTALTAGQIGVLLPIVAGASQVLDDVVGSERAQALVPDTVVEAAVIAVVVIAAAWLLSFLGAVVAFAGFTVTRDGDRLRVRRGLLQRREASIPVARIHAVRIVESPLRQPFGLAEVRVESAGYATEERPARTLFPLLPARDVRALLTELLPEHELPGVALERPPARARRRYALPPAVVALLLTAPLAVALPAAAPALVAVPLAALYGLARWRAAGVALSDGRVVLRRRTLGRTTLVADARRLQHVRRTETVLTRRAGLAGLGVAVASGAAVAVAHLERRAVDGCVARLAALSAGRG